MCHDPFNLHLRDLHHRQHRPTFWVARTLHKNGRLFLIDAFHGDEARADAVNHLLVVGFYLINFGFILLFLSRGTKPTEPVEAIEYTATKLGVVLIVLGAMHFFNMFNFDKMRKKGRLPAKKTQEDILEKLSEESAE